MARRQDSQDSTWSGRLIIGIGVAVFSLLIVGTIGVNVFAGGLSGLWGAPAQNAEALESCPAPVMTPGVMTSGVGGEQFDFSVTNIARAYPVEATSRQYLIAGGVSKTNQRQGVIGVQWSSTDPCLHPGGGGTSYDTPAQDGSVTLTRLQGDNVLFTTADGQSGSFDFVTGVFH